MNTSIKQHIPICFIVLHYINSFYTEIAVDSILDLDHFSNSKIIIVDNASPNRSGKSIKKKYEKNDSITVLSLLENKGFSDGNNSGYCYAKEHYESDFIISVNNDVKFIQKDFIPRLYELYEETPFWVAGPDIYVPSRRIHQSPILEVQEFPTESQILEHEKKDLIHMNKFIRYSLSSIKEYILYRYENTDLFKILVGIKRALIKEKTYHYQNENCVIKGACIIVDKRFISDMDYLFRPITFLYYEEELLKLECYLNNRNMVYFPQLLVIHYDKGSINDHNISYFEYRRRRIKMLCQLIESAHSYLDYYHTVIKE